MGIENKYDEPDLDIEFISIDKELKRAPEKRRNKLDVGVDAGRDESSYLRRDSEAEALAKAKAAAVMAKALSDDAPFIVPSLEVREGDQEVKTEVSMDAFKRGSTGVRATQTKNKESNFIILVGLGAMLFVGMLLFVIAKLL